MGLAESFYGQVIKSYGTVLGFFVTRPSLKVSDFHGWPWPSTVNSTRGLPCLDCTGPPAERSKMFNFPEMVHVAETLVGSSLKGCLVEGILQSPSSR